MKWIPCAAAFIALVFPACKKHSHSVVPPSGISCTVDGISTTFNEKIWLDTVDMGVIINGIGDTVSGLPYIQIGISPAGQMQTGIYPNDSLTTPGGNASAIVYNTASGTGVLNSLFFSSSDDSVSVTAVNGSLISGTFHGTAKTIYFDVNTATLRDSVITMTEGKFNINL